MKYVDAGYVIALSVLFVYAVGLVVRRRRLERAAGAQARVATAAGGGSPGRGRRAEGGS